MVEQLKLIITDNDLTKEDRTWIDKEFQKIGTLGNDEARKGPIFEIVPKLIARRLSSLNIPEFHVSEISLELGFSGKLLGTGIDGKASIKLTKNNEAK